mmetsp:Transcript_81309/g.161397  ORF Transcript_81309/g.161397 Transcript_81309/m.161397 type:complete len:476 (-) Transcript_81309:53-1480(-)
MAAAKVMHTVRDLRAELERRGLGLGGCVEKKDLIERLERSKPASVRASATADRETAGANRPSAARRPHSRRSFPRTPQNMDDSARTVQELKEELTKMGVSYAGCLEKEDLVWRIRQARAATTAPDDRHRPRPPMQKSMLLAALQGSLATQGTQVDFVDMRRGSAAIPLALEDAVQPNSTDPAKSRGNNLLVLKDAPRPSLRSNKDGSADAYEESRRAAYQSAASAGSACTVLALPMSRRVGSDACTPLLAYRHGGIVPLPPTSTLEELRDAYRAHRLFEKLEIDVNMFESAWDLSFAESPFVDRGFRDNRHVRGGLPYLRPIGWQRFGLRVADRFPNRDWLAQDGRPGEWAVAYHGTASYSVRPIAEAAKLRIGGRSGVSRVHGAMFGDGVYCAPHVEHAAFFAEAVTTPTEDGERHFQVVFQCRVRPGSYEVHNDGLGDVFVVRSEADIRPYGILLGECRADGTPLLDCRHQWP